MAISTTRRTLTTLFSRSLSYKHPPPSLPSRSSYAPSFLSHQPTQLAPPDPFRFQSRSESTWSALNGSDHKRSNREEEAKTKIDPVSKSDSHRYRKSQHMCPLHFHYEDVLRQDLMLKLNPANVMQVPRLSKITVQQKAAPSSSNTKNGKLAMEILCGQKFIQTETALTGKSSKSNQFLRSNKDKRGFVSSLAYQSTLRADGMLHFMVRILTVMSLFDFPVKIGGKSIQFSMEMEFCEVSPELESHLEIFEEITGFNVSIATSANTKAETLLLWSGFLHQDEGEK